MSHALGHVLAAIERHNQAAARDQVYESLEGCLHGVEVGVDVGVVKLDVGQNQRIGKVMEKFRPLVEEGGIVFVALHDEGARGPQLKAGSKVLRHAADQKRRLQCRRLSRGHLVYPCQHAGGGGFAVRAGNHQRLAADEKLFAQQRGHRGEGNALVEYPLHFRIAARERIADDDQIRLRIEIGFSVRLQHRNPKPAQQIAHGRIGCLVGAGNAVPLQLQQPGQRRHGRAANSAQMNVPGRTASPIHRRFKQMQLRLRGGGQLGLNAKGQRHILPRDVAAAQPDGDGSVEVRRAR